MVGPSWLKGPLLPRLAACCQVVGTNARGQVPIGVPVSVETPTFVGHMCNSIRGCPGTPQAEFRGTKLLGKSIIQVGTLTALPVPARLL